MTDSLLSRLQSLTEPSQEIDVEVYRALVEPLAQPFKEYIGSVWISASRGIPVPRYTASIDAALTLVPILDGPGRALWINLHETIGGHGTSGCTWSAEIWGVVPVEGGDPTEVKDFKYWGLHPLAAVAILIAVERMRIAILKAKEETKP